MNKSNTGVMNRKIVWIISFISVLSIWVCKVYPDVYVRIILGYMLIWCLFIILLIKPIRLLFIRFSHKDKLVSKNILITVLIITAINFLSPVFNGTIYSDWLFLDSLLNVEINILFGLVKGFFAAYVVVVPVTLISRHIKVRKNKIDAMPKEESVGFIKK